METQLKSDEQLLKNFMCSCGETGISTNSAILKEVHEMLLDRMLHTHGNELIQNRWMLTNLQEGHVDAPLMLRDCLEVVAATNSKQLIYLIRSHYFITCLLIKIAFMKQVK